MDLPELGATLRKEPVPATATVVVRGGPDSVAKLVHLVTAGDLQSAG